MLPALLLPLPLSLPLLLLLLSASGAGSVEVNSSDQAMRLSQHLSNIKNDVNILPLINQSGLLDIATQFYLVQLHELDSSKQKMVASGYLICVWAEERLVWNATEFGDIKSVARSPLSLWTPTIFIENGVGDHQIVKPTIPVSLVSFGPSKSEGQCLIRRQFEVSCKFDVQRFPHDVQRCEILFSPYSPSDNQNIHLVPGFANNISAFYQANSEWTLINVSSRNGTRKFQLSSTFVHEMRVFEISVSFKRVYLYYLLNLVLPNIYLTCLLLLVFFIPNDCGEKMSLGITILLSFTVFLLLLDSMMPKSMEMPIISYFITGAMCMSAISLFITAFILRLHFTASSVQMPRLVRTVLVLGLARLMLVPEAAGVSEREKALKRRRRRQQQQRQEDDAGEQQQHQQQHHQQQQQQQQQQRRPSSASSKATRTSSTQCFAAGEFANPAYLPDGDAAAACGVDADASSDVDFSDWHVAAAGLDRCMMLIGAALIVTMFCMYILPVVVPPDDIG